jgi:hypothetical protein
MAGPAPTIRLATSPARTAPTLPGGTPRPTMPGTGAPTIALPKATMQLQAPTHPLGSSTAPKVATFTSLDTEEEVIVDPQAKTIKILSIVGFAAALIVLSLQLMTASTWINAEDNAQKGTWTQLMD